MARVSTFKSFLNVLGVLGRLVVGLVLYSELANQQAAANDRIRPDGHQPRPCLGYVPETGEWASTDTLPNNTCPPHMALYGTFSPRRPGGDEAKHVGIAGNCCPLPAKDILSETYEHVDSACPEGFVVVGGDKGSLQLRPGELKTVRCALINLRRYRLGPKTPGSRFGPHPASAFIWKERERLKQSDIPLAIRFGLTRLTEYRMEEAGCIGSPPGSLLTAKYGRRCKELIFQRLEYAGLPGDPPAGTPVTMFAVCSQLTNLFGADGGCRHIPELETFAGKDEGGSQ